MISLDYYNDEIIINSSFDYKNKIKELTYRVWDPVLKAWKTTVNNLDEVIKGIMIRRTKEQVLPELPPKRRTNVLLLCQIENIMMKHIPNLKNGWQKKKSQTRETFLLGLKP